jgi:hypothetical protein
MRAWLPSFGSMSSNAAVSSAVFEKLPLSIAFFSENA